MKTSITLTRFPHIQLSTRNKISKLSNKSSVWVGGNPDNGPARDYYVGDWLTDKQVQSLCNKECSENDTIVIELEKSV